MKKRSVQKKVQKNTDSCGWFDTDNARLIILCAIFGMFGVHKFVQGKKGQGWLFILLDLTIIGLVVTWIWSLIDLVKFTVKKGNKPGNMILGSVFLLFGIISLSAVDSVDNVLSNTSKSTTKIEEADVNEVIKEPIFEGKMECLGKEKDTGADIVVPVDVKLYDRSVVISAKGDLNITLGYAITMPGGNMVYTDDFDFDGNLVKKKANKEDFDAMAFMQDGKFAGRLDFKGNLLGVYADYDCNVTK